MRLAIAMGNVYAADGAYFQAVRVAQRYWCDTQNPKQLIPVSAWTSSDLPRSLIDANLVEEREGGFYLKGSEEHFAWFFRRQAAGQKSAEARRQKHGTAQPMSPEQCSSNVGTMFEQPRSSSSSSSSEEGREESSAAPSDPVKTVSPARVRKPKILSGEGPTPWDLIELWNATAHDRLPRVEAEKVKTTGKRFKRAQTRLREDSTLEYWQDLITRVNNSKFCLGLKKIEDGRRPWRADFDWLLQDDVPAKLYEGKYDR